MGKIKLLNTSNNSYFENNQIDISDSIPTEGNHIVGDIVIISPLFLDLFCLNLCVLNYCKNVGLNL